MRGSILPAALAAAVVAAGCGGEDSPSADQARATTAEFLLAYADYDVAICELSSEDLETQAALAPSPTGESAEDCADAIGKARETVPEGEDALLISDEVRAAAETVDEAELEIEGDHARVTFTAPEGESPVVEFVALVVENGEWRVDEFETGSG